MKKTPLLCLKMAEVSHGDSASLSPIFVESLGVINKYLDSTSDILSVQTSSNDYHDSIIQNRPPITRAIQSPYRAISPILNSHIG